MEERGSKEKVIREIKNYQRTILQDFWEGIQAIKSETKTLFEEGRDEKRHIRTSEINVPKEYEICYKVVDVKMAKRLKKMLYSIKENNLESGLKIYSNFINTEDENDGYEQLFAAYQELFEKIESLPTDYNFMISALNLAQM